MAGYKEEARYQKRRDQEETYETATARASARRKRRKLNDNRITIALIICVVAVFSTVLVVRISSAKATLSSLKEEKAKLTAEYDEQLKLSEKLKEKEVYVKTNSYIEEQARKLGLVYPDEVIFKPADK